MTGANAFTHEQAIVRRGERSHLPVIVAVHSTGRGSAVGGCRLWAYDDWTDGLADALRLSEAMSLKCASAEIAHGGGKSVIALPAGTTLTRARREAVMEDLGDIVNELDGHYYVGADVGTGADDMRVIRRRTPWTADPDLKRLATDLGIEPTSEGVYESMKATAAHIFGDESLEGRRVAVAGLGSVGAPLARRLAQDGALLVVSDLDESRKALAIEIGAQWEQPSDVLFSDVDIAVPAAIGGVLTPDSVRRLRCRAVVGPANNQLSDDSVADLLKDLGIVWAPDFVVNAGGVVWGVGTDIGGREVEQVLAEVRRIGPRLASVLRRAADTNVAPLTVALSDARSRLPATDYSSKETPREP